MQLLTDPNIVFCDEPTTGLDSFNALSIVQALKSLTRQAEFQSQQSIDSIEMVIILPSMDNEQPSNRAIVCSIHQPTSAVFECFSDVILMKAGQIIFQGSVDEAHKAFYRYEFIKLFDFLFYLI